MAELTRYEIYDLLNRHLDGHYLWLVGVDLSGADLRWANLVGVDLQEANLREANLQEARLDRANLRNADLCAANLEGARFNGAILPDGQRWRWGADIARFTDSDHPDFWEPPD